MGEYRVGRDRRGSKKWAEDEEEEEDNERKVEEDKKWGES